MIARHRGSANGNARGAGAAQKRRSPAGEGGASLDPIFAGAYLASRAVSVTAWPAEDTSLPAPSTVLQAAIARLATAVTRMISLRIGNIPLIQKAKLKTPSRRIGSPEPEQWSSKGVRGFDKRLVYLCAGQAEADWAGRVKVPLGAMTWPPIQGPPPGGRIEGRAPGQGRNGLPALATVPILAPGWGYSHD